MQLTEYDYYEDKTGFVLHSVVKFIVPGTFSKTDIGIITGFCQTDDDFFVSIDNCEDWVNVKRVSESLV